MLGRAPADELGVGCGEEAFIDGTYVPAKGGGLCVGRCRAGSATKVMAIADHRGLPMSRTLLLALASLALFATTADARCTDAEWAAAKAARWAAAPSGGPAVPKRTTASRQR